MASKPLIPDSSINEQQLNPHLRRRSGGRSYSTIVTGGGSGSDTTLARYTGTGGSTTVTAWDRGAYAIAATTALNASADVTDTDPWTYTPATETRVVVNITATIAASCGIAYTVAIQRDGVDVAWGASTLTWGGIIPAGSTVTACVRYHASGADATIAVSAITVEVLAG